MIVSIIAALGKNRVIGNKNSLPWNMPADMTRFRDLTIGKPIIVGSRTFESIGRALPERHNIVLTRNADYKAPGCKIAHSLKEAILLAQESSLGKESKEVMICGGASIYRQFLPLTDRMYLTLIHHNFEGDSYFPEFDEKEWEEKENISYNSDKKNPHKYSFLVLVRKHSRK